jgi:hypothetical protein
VIAEKQQLPAACTRRRASTGKKNLEVQCNVSYYDYVSCSRGAVSAVIGRRYSRYAVRGLARHGKVILTTVTSVAFLIATLFFF